MRSVTAEIVVCKPIYEHVSGSESVESLELAIMGKYFH
jgi:hypothetical protein